MRNPLRHPALLVGGVLAIAVVAVPVLGQELTASPSASASASAEPSTSADPAPSTEPTPTQAATPEPATPSPGVSAAPSGQPAATAKPGATEDPEKPGKGPKGERVPEVPVSLTGRIDSVTGDEGEIGYTLTVGTTVYTLEIGPRWWWAGRDPLATFVGRTVRVDGERAEGSTSIDVFVAGGTTLRAPGKPPWAGGWKVVGERHPGWADWKAAKWAAKWPDGKPGHGPKDARGAGGADDDTDVGRDP